MTGVLAALICSCSSPPRRLSRSRPIRHPGRRSRTRRPAAASPHRRRAIRPRAPRLRRSPPRSSRHRPARTDPARADAARTDPARAIRAVDPRVVARALFVEQQRGHRPSPPSGTPPGRRRRSGPAPRGSRTPPSRSRRKEAPRGSRRRRQAAIAARERAEAQATATMERFYEATVPAGAAAREAEQPSVTSSSNDDKLLLGSGLALLAVAASSGFCSRRSRGCNDTWGRDDVTALVRPRPCGDDRRLARIHGL